MTAKHGTAQRFDIEAGGRIGERVRQSHPRSDVKKPEPIYRFDHQDRLMEEPEVIQPIHRRSKRIGWICWAVLAGAGLIIIGNVGLITVDINRDVPPPENAARFVTITGEHAGIQDSASIPVILAPNLESSITTLVDAPLFGKRNRANVDEDIEAMNKAYHEALKSYIAYQKQAAALTRDEASKRVTEMNDLWRDAIQAHYYKQPALRDWFNKENLEAYEKINIIYSINYKLMLDLAVRDQDWMAAAAICREGCLGWDAQVYYLRKMGSKGTAMIAKRTSERYWEALERSILSIGLDFHWPRLQKN